MVRPLLPPGFWPRVFRLVMDSEWPPQTPADAAAFVEMCAWHGVLSLLFRENDLPPVLETARDARAIRERVAAVRVRVVHDILARISELLADEPFTLLKGADFMHRLYPAPHLRPSQDVDILVPPSRFPAVCRLIERGGFAQVANRRGATFSPNHYERTFANGTVSVDVHQAFAQHLRYPVQYDGIWARRDTVQVRDRSFSRLSDVDALAYHTLSMAKDEFHSPLLRYVDLWLLIGRQEGIVLAAAERAREWKATRAYYGTLSLACRAFPVFRTTEVEAAMTRVLHRGSRRFLDAWVLPSNAELRYVGVRPSRQVQLWRKAFLIDTWPRRIGFPIQHAAASIRWGRGLRPSAPVQPRSADDA